MNNTPPFASVLAAPVQALGSPAKVYTTALGAQTRAVWIWYELLHHERKADLVRLLTLPYNAYSP